MSVRYAKGVYAGFSALVANGGDFEDLKAYLKSNVWGGRGFWTVVGISRSAMEVLKAQNFSTKGLERDHMFSKADFVAEVLANVNLTADEFVSLWEKFGKVILVTKGENTSKGSGFGTTYQTSDVSWLTEGLDTYKAIKLSKKTARDIVSLVA
jgi:hypothetical protein